MSSNKNFNYIIYHKNCIDGFAGFFIAYLSNKLLQNVNIYGDQPSTKTVPSDIDDKDIIIIDVAYNKDVLEQICKYAKSVVFIDHHDGIKQDVVNIQKKYNNIEIIYDEEFSGASLSWKYFNGDDKIPSFIRYIQDNDTGKWLDKNTRPFIYALRTFFKLEPTYKNIKQWNKLFDNEYVLKMIKKGSYMEKYSKYLIKKNMMYHTIEKFPSKKIYNLSPDTFKEIGQYKVAVFCGGSCPSVSDLAIETMKTFNCDFCIMWTYNIDSKKYILSMRSTIVNIGEICRIFGGNGHKLAASCSFFSTDYNIHDLFEGKSLPRNYK